ncbi:MAG: hypothetical protein HN764_00540 [Gammaproteobacteria bacterium]|jgi:hypothetical protein|nr:hypothetical protein [Gammaproteobacteria bacterium]
MISSLTSKFSYFDRRALFISAHKVAVYHWQNGDIASSYLFDTNEEGREYFNRYLSETKNNPFYILVDVFEEEFRKETIPHVFGPDRQALLNRKQDRLFRDTPYTFSEMQGREESGRRDDKLLLTAITNPALIKPWTAMLDAQKTPIAGIYSLPFLTNSLLKIRPEFTNHTLLVSLQSISGLRQTFVQNGELRISRLVQMPRYGTEPYAPYIAGEVEKIQRYVNSLRIIPNDEALDICFLLAGDLLKESKELYEDSEHIKYHLIDINELAEQSGLQTRVKTPFSDQLFISQLLKKAPANQYAEPTERRYFSMRKMRYSMIAASMLLMMFSVVWSGYNFVKGLSFKQQSVAAELRTKFYSARYEMARQRLPETPVEPVDLQHAVELSDTLNKYKTSPLALVQVTSEGLNKFSDIQLKNINWVTSIDPNVDVGGKQQTNMNNQNQIGFSDISSNETGYLFYQVSLIEGFLEPFNGDYREAIASINEYADFLRNQDSVHDVSILTLPLDVSSSTNMQGNTQAQGKSAEFSLRLVIGITDEA